MRETLIQEIDHALKFHSGYENFYGNGDKYLRTMDALAAHYPQNARGMRLSAMLDDYFKAVGVANLDEAFDRLREQEKQAES